MNLWIALLKREWLEHRGALLWAPIATLGLLMIAVALFVIFNTAAGNATEQVLANSTWGDSKVAAGLEYMRRSVAKPFAIVFFGAVFFLLLGALFDDRRDHSVLFWKSIAVSDSQTVLSKLVLCVFCAPLITLLAIVAAQLFALLVLSGLVSGTEQMSAGRLWSNAGLLPGTLELAAGFVTQGFWMLPIWSWLLLVSAAVTRLPLIWALLTPIVPIVLERALFNTTELLGAISAHLQLRAMPVNSKSEQNPDAIAIGLPEMADLWLSSGMWGGLATSAVLLTAAIYLRRRNNEI